MIRIIFAALVALALSACAGMQTPLDDGYQFGDLTATVAEIQAQYCATADPYQRAVLLALLERSGANIPDRGACTDLLELIPEGEVPAVDVEAARADQDRFQGD